MTVVVIILMIIIVLFALAIIMKAFQGFFIIVNSGDVNAVTALEAALMFYILISRLYV